MNDEAAAAPSVLAIPGDGPESQAKSAGIWPSDFPLTADGKVEEGLVVLSQSGALEGRTTGARTRCLSTDCPGWFIGVSWETGQRLRPCSQGWHYDEATETVRITGGGEISARVVSPTSLGVAPRSRGEWPDRNDLTKAAGWKAGDIDDHHLTSAIDWVPSELDPHSLDDVLAALDGIATASLTQKWASKADRVFIEATPSWLANWIDARDLEASVHGRIGRAWHPLAPESWRLHLRIVKSLEGSGERTDYRDDGWIHPHLPPEQWPELTRRIWEGATVTDAAAAMLREGKLNPSSPE
jgi:hypothetical protein